jgi:hypothetical protein
MKPVLVSLTHSLTHSLRFLCRFIRLVLTRKLREFRSLNCITATHTHAATRHIFFGYRSKLVARSTKKVGYRRFTYEPGSQILSPVGNALPKAGAKCLCCCSSADTAAVLPAQQCRATAQQAAGCLRTSSRLLAACTRAMLCDHSYSS